MNIIVCENFTALLRDESKIEDAFFGNSMKFSAKRSSDVI